MDGGLGETTDLWPPVKTGFGFVHRAAGILRNQEGLVGAAVREHYQDLLEQITGQLPDAGPLQPALEHFLKVTDSYQPGLFHCYDVADLPRTNNDLEQLFGSTRYHERRCTGRKVASPSLVLRGAVRIVAGLGTRNRRATGRQLAPRDVKAWQALRNGLEQRRQRRTLRQRFRRDPAAYLKHLEDILLKQTLPP